MTETIRPLRLDTRSAPEVTHRRLQELRRDRPEWEPWLRLYEIVLSSDEDRAWSECGIELASRAEREPGLPVMQGATITLRREPAGALLERLSTAAGLSAAPFDPAEILEASINQDGDRLQVRAAMAGVDPDPLSAIAHLAAMPVLRSIHHRLGSRAGKEWRYGHCPTCGAWATIIEQSGLNRERHLRCARCGADWIMESYRCALCGEHDFEKLGSLVPESEIESQRVETCDSCHGYLKSIAALRPASASDLPLHDLATVELDLAALDHGYVRPERPAVDLTVTVNLI